MSLVDLEQIKKNLEGLSFHPEWREDIRALVAEVEALRAVVPGLGEAVRRREADLAVAGAVLEKIAREGVDTMTVAAEALNRLSTGEALEAVRHAERSLVEAFGPSHPAVISLRAVFGEKP